MTQAKTFICRLWILFYNIHCSIFSTLEVILCQSEVLLPRYGRKRSFVLFETGFTTFVVLFLAIWRLFLVDWKYPCQDAARMFIRRLWNRLYSSSSSIFRIWRLFLALCRLFLVDRRYSCQNTSENVHSPGFETCFTAFPVLFFALWMLFWVYWR